MGLRRFIWTIAIGISALAVAPASSAQADAAPAASAPADGSISLDRELAELDRTRKEFADLSGQLEEQRAELERANQRAQSRQNMSFVAVAVGVLVLLAMGLAWLAKKRKKNLEQSED